jgi:hypothetical protein
LLIQKAFDSRLKFPRFFYISIETFFCIIKHQAEAVDHDFPPLDNVNPYFKVRMVNYCLTATALQPLELVMKIVVEVGPLACFSHYVSGLA